MRKLKNLMLLPSLVTTIYKNLNLQNKFLKRHIAPVLQKALANNDGTINPKDINKILKYYGLAVPAILAEGFFLLQGIKLPAKQRWISTCQGAMTGLFDDFFDEHTISHQKIEEKINRSNPSAILNSNEILFDFFYNKLLKLTGYPLQVQETLYNVYHQQVKSTEQLSPYLDKKAIIEITQGKGGASLLFYRTGLDALPGKNERDVLYRLGGLMQLSNDIFDVYKDKEAGIKSLVTTTKDMGQLTHFFLNEMRQAYQDAYKLSCSQKNIRKFLSLLSLSIFSRSFVCLAQLEKLQKKTEHVFILEAYSRKELICDMDTKKNMLHSAAYHIKYFF